MKVYLITLVIFAVLALIPANIARSKGYSFGLWWFYGWMFFIVAIIHVCFISDKSAQQAPNIRKIVTLGMLAAVAYGLMYVSRFLPAIAAGFLKYDPKDIIIVICGFIFGPVSALGVSVVVAFLEMVTVSTTGWIGLVMNILSSGVFACTASIIYKKKHTLKGAVSGLALACIFTTIVMLAWNFFLVPIYQGTPRQAIEKMLLPVFLPFNLIKTVANASLTMILYKPLVTALRRGKMVHLSLTDQENKKQRYFKIIGASLLILITAVLAVLVINGVI